ncbi:MAG: hypothetical protein C3F02_04670 [Parcubacteria group bacterium]|nr:MAG: hypothetical protein C3F02_04670 [Parcubacteria group bacterium]
MAKPDLSIIIVNWKVRRLLDKCLQSLEKYSHGLKLEIFVVDNDSQDGTSEMLIMDFPDVISIALPRNHGFAKACNLGIKQSDGDYILLLNPDTEIGENTLPGLLEYMRQHPEVGILGPKILSSDGTVQHSVRKFPDLHSQILTLLKLQNIISPQLAKQKKMNMPPSILLTKVGTKLSAQDAIGEYLQENFDYSRTQEVEQVMGAAMLINRKLVDQIGLLDEKFFVWFEEVDYCLRARRAGWSVVFFPQATLRHQAGASFNQRGIIRKQFIFNRSLLHFFWKNKPRWQWLILLLLTPLNIMLTIYYAWFLHPDEEE